MAVSDLKVIGIMGRGDFDDAGAKFRIGVLIGDDGNEAVDNWENDFLADKMLVALIFRMNGDRGIAKEGFRAGCGHFEVTAVIF